MGVTWVRRFGLTALSRSGRTLYWDVLCVGGCSRHGNSLDAETMSFCYRTLLSWRGRGQFTRWDSIECCRLEQWSPSLHFLTELSPVHRLIFRWAFLVNRMLSLSVYHTRFWRPRRLLPLVLESVDFFNSELSFSSAAKILFARPQIETVVGCSYLQYSYHFGNWWPRLMLYRSQDIFMCM